MMARMALVLAHPFRIAAGRIVTVEAASDPGVAQAIAQVVTTRLGERELVPSFGVRDPAFVGLDPGDVNSCLALHGPAAIVTSIDVVDVTASSERLLLSFRPADGAL
jgi:hypothetical protein